MARKYSQNALYLKLLEERNAVIYDLYVRQRKTLEQIGSQYGVSRERIRQILKDQFGITSDSVPSRTWKTFNRVLKAFCQSTDIVDQMTNLFLKAALRRGYDISCRLSIGRNYLTFYVNGKCLWICNPKTIWHNYFRFNSSGRNSKLIILSKDGKHLAYFFETLPAKVHYIKADILDKLVGRTVIFDCKDACLQFGRRRNIPDEEMREAFALFGDDFHGLAAAKGVSWYEVVHRAKRLGLYKSVLGSTRSCIRCGNDFVVVGARQLYCSDRCSNAVHYQTIKARREAQKKN